MEIRIAQDTDIDTLINIRLEMLRVVNNLPTDYNYSEDFISNHREYFLNGNQTTVLAITFDTVAEKYARMRPDYPKELYDDIFKMISLDSSSRAVEVGIGGGQATLPILKTGCSVTAVEYGKNFTELCREKFKDYQNFSVVNTKFEDFECERDSCDLIYSASAFHWVPEEIGYPKVFDMLKSGGVFARFANHPTDIGNEDLNNAIQELYAIYMPNSKTPNPRTEEEAALSRAEIARKYGFIDISYRLYNRTRDFSAKEYTELLGTYSDHIALPENVRQEFYAKIEKAINDFGGVITIYDTIDLQLARKPN